MGRPKGYPKRYQAGRGGYGILLIFFFIRNFGIWVRVLGIKGTTQHSFDLYLFENILKLPLQEPNNPYFTIPSLQCIRLMDFQFYHSIFIAIRF